LAARRSKPNICRGIASETIRGTSQVEKRQLDSFRMQESHPAADYDSLPEEVNSLELENYDNKQGALALQTLFYSGIGGYFLIPLHTWVCR
jgi:hypothetical protein